MLLRSIVFLGTLTISMFQCVTPSHADCENVLLLTGRNYLEKRNFRDSQAAFYKDACKSGDTTASANYKDLQKTFGFAYSNRDDFCNKESNSFENYNFDYLSSSVVVENALDVYRQCKALEKQRISIDINLSSERFSIDLGRGGITLGRFNGWQTSSNIKCSLVGASDARIVDESSKIDLSLTLPDTAKLSIACVRTGFDSAVVPGAVTYPESNIIVFTSEGSINFLLPSANRLGETWASDVELKFKTTNKQIIEIQKQLSELDKKKISEVFLNSATEVGSSQNNSRGSLESNCPSGTLVSGIDTNITGVLPFNRVRCLKLDVDRK